MKVKDIVKATGGTLVQGNPEDEIIGMTQDTRTLKRGEMYVALLAGRNGHDFIETVEGKAKAVLVSQNVHTSIENVIKVEDTLKAMGDIARYIRDHSHALVIGITGSVGKTSTKDMIYSVVSTKYKAMKTIGNYNNNIGMPMSMFRYNGEEVMVIEMGMNHKGELRNLTHIAKPDVAVITNVGTAHIGELGSRTNILRAKMEITDGMNKEGTLIINGDNDLLSMISFNGNLKRVGIECASDLPVSDIKLEEDHSTFVIQYDHKEYEVYVPVAGKHFVLNALIAIEVGLTIDIPILDCIKGVREFKLTKKRNDVIELKNHIKLIDGSYNANLDSMKSSIDTLSGYKGRKIAILGDMMELGKYEKRLHQEVGEYILDKDIDVVVCVGLASKNIFDEVKGVKEAYHFLDYKPVGKFLKTFVHDYDILLVKGSNGMKLSHVVDYLKEKIGMKKLLILCGGQSTEHVVSRMSATSVLKNIHSELYKVTLVGIEKNGSWYILDQDQEDLADSHWLDNSTPIDDIYGLIKEQDVVFPILHGLYGEDGTIQGLLELAGVPYVGCRVLSSSVSMDKIYTKKILKTAGIPQVNSLYVKKRYDGKLVVIDDDFNEYDDVAGVIKEKLGMPVFIKASRSGSSVGCYRCDEEDQLLDRLNDASQYDRHIVVEECIDCIELETAVLGNDDPVVSRVGQIMPHGEFYTFESKYQDAQSKTCIPALVDEEIQEEIRKLALRVFKALDGHGLSRVDFFLDKKTNKIYLNEINTMPGFTNISMYPQLMNDLGISYSELIDRLIALAFDK